jgi:hypothetical protein
MKKFTENDIFINTIKTYPKVRIFVNSGSVYYNDSNQNGPKLNEFLTAISDDSAFVATPSFTPADLTNLRAWYKSDAGITIATGVSQWNDQSGNGNHLVQANPARQPVVTAGAINGLPVITFDGVDDFLNDAFTLVQPTTVFAVFRQRTWTINDYIYDGFASTGMGLSQRVATPGLSLIAGAAAANNTNAALSTYVLTTAIYSGASSVLQVNNTAETTGNPGIGSGDGVTLAASGGSSTLFTSDCEIAEVIVMGAAATASERASVRAYSQARYGVGA